MYSPRLRKFLIICLFLFSFAFLASAQEATIVGTVTDPSGAPVPNVTITMTNTATGVVHTTVSNSVGQYVAPNLYIGNYIIRAQAPGFKVAEQKDLVLNVGDRARVDIKLEIGTAQESVTVEATPIAVQADTGEVSTVISGTQVSQLATNGRTVYSLAYLTPGASSNMPDFQSPTAVGANANVSFNGLRQNHNLWLADGGENSDRGGAGGIDIMPSMDAIAEFRVLSSNYSAEYGLSSAGTMTLVFKSGTKQFHANAWEFVRNDAFDATGFFTHKADKLRLNTYGFNVGGPVVIPKIYRNKDHDKTFFFYNMEWRKMIQGSQINQTVPMPGTYTGNFGNAAIHVPRADQLAPSILQKFTALGLQPGEAFPNNTIPVSLLDTNAQALLKAGIFPAPTQGAQYIGAPPIPTNVREELVRVDHQFSEKFMIFGHWVSEQTSQDYATTLWNGGSNVPTVGTTFGNPSYSAVIRATHSISPTLLNEMAFNYNGNRIIISPTGNYRHPSDLNIPELFSGNNLNRIPGIQLQGSTGTGYDVGSWPWYNKCDDYQIRDDISWTKGSHQLKMGASWAIYKKVQDLFGNTQGVFRFNGGYTGNDFADFLLGLANQYNELAVQDKGLWNSVSWAAYAQDNWRVTRRLTLNLGLRWDGVPHTYEANSRMANFYPGLYNPANAAILDPNNPGTILPSSPGLGPSPNPALSGLLFYLNGIGLEGKNGIPKGLVQNHWAAFGPRIGFALDVTGTGRTVLRGGFGTMYERMQGNDMYNAGPNQPFSASVTFDQVSLSNPKTSLLTGQTLTAPITVGDITGLAYTDYKLPVSYQYSIGVQHQLWREGVLSVAYVGNQNRHQNDYRETNLPNPSVLPGLINNTVSYNTVVPYRGFHSIRMSEMAQNSHYNGLQTSLSARVEKDLTLQVAYTFSRSMDPAVSFGGDNTNTENPYDRAYDWGPANVDRTHVGVVSFVYDLPFFRGASSRAVKTALGGWQLSGIGLMQSGLPLNITLGGSQGSNGIPNSTNRPDLVGTISYPQTVQQWFNPAAFGKPAVGAWGSLGKGAVRGPGRHNWNISLFKNFVFNEARGSGLELRIETFNTFNHVQLGNQGGGISTSYSASNFGQVTGAWDPRVFQFGMKLHF